MVKIIALSEARALNLPGRKSREIIGVNVGAQSSTMRLVEIAPEDPGEARRGPHVHSGFEECIYVMDGQGITCTDAEKFSISAGDTVLVPSNERHATYNTGPNVLRLLCFFPVNDIASHTREFASWDEQGGRGNA
jgi:quercetin dioxygenase-like cupin family protein